MASIPAPPGDPTDPLAVYWEQPVYELTECESTPISREERERLSIFSLLTMAITFDAWNGNKHDQWGDYPWREGQKIEGGLYRGGRYFGHNIGCIAVDARGAIIDFDFNHNDLFSSSAEHAEARLVRRIFNLNQNYDRWQTIDPSQIINVSYGTILSGVSLYTSLESCAQCSGIMTLGNVKRVIYLQSDPGQYKIGNILYNLSNPLAISHPSGTPSSSSPPVQKYGAPEPVSADLFDFPYKKALDEGYAAFAKEMAANPDHRYFWKPPDGANTDASKSITSFLCTDMAQDIYRGAAEDLTSFRLEYPEYVPADGPSNSLSNINVLDQALRFRAYVAKAGNRGTPHK
jgi:tRNA(Arg) A34 adenosine deaminase TadA